MPNTLRISIAGYGFVGQAVHSCMQDDYYCIYDPPKKRNNLNALKKSDMIFCCLPTPTNPLNDVSGKQDFTYYKSLFKSLDGYEGTLVIKSTVLYSNLEPYLDKFNIVYNPEFLNQNNFKNDFYTQKVIVLGGEVEHCKYVEYVYSNYFVFSKLPQFEYCSVKEAADLKYTHNVYHAYKVLFWNYIHEVCGNQRKIFDMYSNVTGNENEMARVYADGKAGYGGACFPKDVGAFHEEHEHDLTEFMIKYNKKIR